MVSMSPVFHGLGIHLGFAIEESLLFKSRRIYIQISLSTELWNLFHCWDFSIMNKKIELKKWSWVQKLTCSRVASTSSSIHFIFPCGCLVFQSPHISKKYKYRGFVLGSCYKIKGNHRTKGICCFWTLICDPFLVI